MSIIFEKGRKQFFFEKKNQKTFDYFSYAILATSRLTVKSFLVLFFKKELLSYLPSSTNRCNCARYGSGRATALRVVRSIMTIVVRPVVMQISS